MLIWTVYGVSNDRNWLHTIRWNNNQLKMACLYAFSYTMMHIYSYEKTKNMNTHTDLYL